MPIRVVQMGMFKAILLENSEGQFQAKLAELDDDDLPEGDVTIEVAYSTVNYKDALAITHRAPVVRTFPMVPGIDLAGRVRESHHPDWRPGDWVIANGWGLGEVHWGGLSQRARISAHWLLKLPEPISPRQAMGIGTAGYTAMLCVMALEHQSVTPDQGDILVTGASGGVGAFAIAILTQLGYRVVASTGQMDETDRLKRLGAVEVIDRSTLSAPGKPLAKERWKGAIDTVGSHTLANVCAGLCYKGVAIACGMAQGVEFPGSLAPFILRGATLVGIDSVYAPIQTRETAWSRLCRELDLSTVDAAIEEIPLSDAIARARDLLDGKVRGRLVVDVGR